MRTVSVKGASLLGYLAEPVTVEARFVADTKGKTDVQITGLPDPILRESGRRLQCALEESGLGLTQGRLFLNLVPAARRKSGESLDLPLALAAAAAAGHLEPGALQDALFLGELGLDGSLHDVPGGLSAGLLARTHSLANLIAPRGTAAEAAHVGAVQVFGARNLTQVVAHVTRPEGFLKRVVIPSTPDSSIEEDCDKDPLAQVRGQAAGKQAVAVAALGGHALLWIGPPGAGKTLLSRALSKLQSPPTIEERLEITRVLSAAGLAPTELARVRPFRAPHHTASYAGMVGGGPSVRPGEISLASRGLLFLDELPEFRREVLEALRQPLEEGRVIIARAGAQIELPARFRLVAAMNPCPCGFRGHPTRPCQCPPSHVQRYRARLSGPFLDRIPLRVELQPLRLEELEAKGTTAPGDDADSLLTRLGRARERMQERQGLVLNDALTAIELDRAAPLDAASRHLFELAGERRHLSARAFQGLRQVARTLADLDGVENPEPEHFAGALALRAPLSL